MAVRLWSPPVGIDRGWHSVGDGGGGRQGLAISWPENGRKAEKQPLEVKTLPTANVVTMEVWAGLDQSVVRRGRSLGGVLSRRELAGAKNSLNSGGGSERRQTKRCLRRPTWGASV